jgi:hypothetical protein
MRRLDVHGARSAASAAKEIRMPKGHQRSNKETKKPKQNKKAPPQPFSSVVPQAKDNLPPGKKR